LMMNSGGVDKTATFKNFSMVGAKAGQVVMVGASFDGDLHADSLRAGDNLSMNGSTFKKVSLVGAEVAGNVELVGARVAGALQASGLKVGGSLNMFSESPNEAIFNEVYLVGAKITRDFNLYGARVDGDLRAESVQIGGSLITTSPIPLTYKTWFRGIFDLSLSTVNGQVNMGMCQIAMPNTTFDGDVILEHLHVTGDVLLCNIASNRLLKASYAQIGGNLDFSGAKLAAVDLGGASIVGELRLGNENSGVTWAGAKNEFLNLRSTHVGRLSDKENAWPPRLSLDGFSFDQFGENSSAEMIRRGADWWNMHFVGLDSEHGRSPYEELAAVYAAAGDHDAANDIRYDESVWADQKSSGLAWISSRALRWGAGYGIGIYMFVALAWALSLSLVGAVILFWANKGVVKLIQVKHGCVWCFVWCWGASVNRVLPVLSLKKEFTDFFDNPKLNQFTPFQNLVFAVLAVLGWGLSFIVIAAFATITHGP
jgi:cytoskeletal protein CcmA (bactofilin family)